MSDLTKLTLADAVAGLKAKSFSSEEITQAFLGQALAEEIFACPNSFGGYQQIDTATFFQ